MQTFRSRRALLAACAAPLALGACGVNAIPTKDEVVKAKWADVQSNYQRRSDLIPNLVATVQAAAQNERATLVQVQQARSAATQVKVDPSTVSDPAKLQQYQAAQGQLSQALGRLLVVTENYPNLKTNDNFIALQAQVESTENRINNARRDYNEAVRDYNTTLRTFPTVLWAKTLYGASKEAVPFSAAADAQNAPHMQFNDPTAGSTMPGAPAPGAAMPGSAGSSSSTTTTTTPGR